MAGAAETGAVAGAFLCFAVWACKYIFYSPGFVSDLGPHPLVILSVNLRIYIQLLHSSKPQSH